MGIIAKYKFNQNVYENFIPEFNSEFTDYTITDEIDTDGYTIRTIESDDLPTLMRFGATTQTDREKSLLEVYECNTENVNNMSNMFRYCSSLTSLNVLSFNTTKVTNMYQMFQNCSSLTSLNVSNFNTENVEYMQDMFRSCSLLTFLDLSNFNTEKVTNMSRMFYSCSSLISLDVSNWNTEKVTNMSGMFLGCPSLTSLNVSNFNTQKVTTMDNMFYNCSSLISLDVSNFNTEKVTNMSGMFYRCSSLTSLNVSNFNTQKVTNMQNMFNGCYLLTSLDVSNFNTSQVTTVKEMFVSCKSLTFLDISSFTLKDGVDTYNMFYSFPSSVVVGMVYCNSSTINKISDRLTVNTTIWYMNAKLEDLTVKDNITYKKYQTTTLSLNEPIQLRSVGDIYDEINYETGEYIQRIGEVVLDGSEDWTFYNSGTVNTISFSTMFEKFDKAICDKFNYEISRGIANGKDEECYTYINDGEKTTKLYIYISRQKANDAESFKQYLQLNPITIQYQLAEPIITKIDTTILDQNNSYKSSQQTYDEQTYISVQSDTIVTPTSSIDYEIYSSTGTITGTSASIDDAEAGTPIEAVVYGETLLNVAEGVYTIQEGVTATIEEDKTYKQIYLKGVSSNTQTVVNPSVVIMSSPFIFGKGGRL